MSRPNWDFSPPTNPVASTSFATESFAEGASRRAYRAMRWKPAHKFGSKAVVKAYKDEYTWAQGDWDIATCIAIYEQTKSLAAQFNALTGRSCPIYVVDYTAEKVNTSNGTPKLGEWVLVEDFLEGQFQKFISNSGWVNP